MSTLILTGSRMLVWLGCGAISLRILAADLFIVDQRADFFGNSSFSVRTNSPIGQSFVPATNAVGYCELNLEDSNRTNGLGAMLHVNLRAYEATTNQSGLPDRISGAVIASSHPTTITNGHSGPARFVFPANIPVTPGIACWIEVVGDSGDDCRAVVYHFSYPRGDAFLNGTNVGGPFSTWDMWFREGVVGQFPRIEWTDRLPPQDISPEILFGRVSGMPGIPIILQESHDLRGWTSLGTNAGSPVPFQVPVRPGQRRFYRALYDQ